MIRRPWKRDVRGGKGSNQYQTKGTSASEEDGRNEAARSFADRGEIASGPRRASAGPDPGDDDDLDVEGHEDDDIFGSGPRDLVVESVLMGRISVEDAEGPLMDRYHPAYASRVLDEAARPYDEHFDEESMRALVRAEDVDKLTSVIMESRSEDTEMSRTVARCAALDAVMKMHPDTRDQYMPELDAAKSRAAQLRMKEMGI